MAWLIRSPLTWRHDELTVGTLDGQHGRFGIAIEFRVQPSKKTYRCRFRQLPIGSQAVDLGLQANVRGRLELQIAAVLVSIEVSDQRPFDVARARIVAFDQVAVVGVHDAHEIGEVGCGTRVQAFAQNSRRRRQLYQRIRDSFGYIG